jgi:hypothetical protein
MRRGRIKLTDELVASKEWPLLEKELNRVFTPTCREHKPYGIIELHGTSPLFEDVKEGEAPEYFPVFNYVRDILNDNHVPRFKKFERTDSFKPVDHIAEAIKNGTVNDKLHTRDSNDRINYPGLNHFEEAVKKGWWDKLSNLTDYRVFHESTQSPKEWLENRLNLKSMKDEYANDLKDNISRIENAFGIKHVSADYGKEDSKPVTNTYDDWIDKKIKEGELQEPIEDGYFDGLKQEIEKARQEFLWISKPYLQEIERISRREVIFTYVEGRVVSRYPEHVENIVKLIYNHIDVLKQQCEDKIAKLIKG